MTCRTVQDLLTEYVMGRYVPERERVAGHLSQCESCDASRRELESVFALLAEVPEAPVSLYGEANTLLALRSEFGSGPLGAEREVDQREAAMFRLCAIVSIFCSFSLLAGGAFLWRTPELVARATQWADHLMLRFIGAGPVWPGLAVLILLMGGTAALVPALLQPDRGAAARRARREV